MAEDKQTAMDLLKQLRDEVRDLQAWRARVESACGGGSGARAPNGATADEATDAELDGRYGNPEIKRNPPRYDGPSYTGLKMSECPSDFLRKLAGFFDWQAKKDEEAGKTYTNKKQEVVPTAPLRRKDASLARGWARRNEGRVMAAPAPAPAAAPEADVSGEAADVEIPF